MNIKFSNEAYDICKFLITKVSPALVALITGLGALYDIDTELIVGTIALFTVFFAQILSISTKNYNAGIAEHPEGMDGSED